MVRKSRRAGSRDSTVQPRNPLFPHQGLATQPEKSTEWYLSAAEAEHATARYHLAKRDERGLGAERDAVEALRWSILAAESATGRLKRNVVAYRDRLLERMPCEQIEKATRLAAHAKGR